MYRSYRDASQILAFDVMVYRDGYSAVCIDRNGNTIIRSSNHGDVIQRAVEEVDSGVVYIDKGVYLLESYDVLSGSINAAIKIKNSVRLIGAGIDKTILRLGSNIAASIIGWDSINTIEIQGLTLDGNKANNEDSGVDGNQAGIIALNSGVYHVIRDIKSINNIRQGIYLGAVQNRVVVDNVIVENNGREGISFDHTINFDVFAVKALNNAHGGIYVSTSSLLDFVGSIVGGFFYGNAIAGIYLYNVRHLVLDGVKVMANRGDGILIQNSSDVEINGAIALANNRNGIYAITASKIRIIGGSMRNNRQDTTNPFGSGVRLYDTTDSIVMGISAYDDQDTKTQLYGVEEAGSSDYNIIVNNNLRGNVNGGVTAVGANTVTTGNII